MLVCMFCGVFGECVAIASVGVVINRPVFDRVGGYGSSKLSFHVEVQGTKHYKNRDLQAESFFFMGWSWGLWKVSQAL